MKEFRLIELMGGIDDDLLKEANAPIPMHRKRGFKIALIAAVLALVILITPVIGAFALVGSYKAEHPEFKGNDLQALDRILGTKDKTFTESLNEKLQIVDWNALLGTVSPDGDVDWDAFLSILRGEQTQEQPEEPLFQYVKTDDGGIRIVGYLGGRERLTIPDTIEGLPVTELGDHAFAKDEAMKHVDIPDTVTLIDMGAFFGCYNLQSVKMSANVEIIGDHAFSCCSTLPEITLPETLHTIGDEAFWVCRNLEKLEIPSSVTYLGEAAFFHANLKEIVIPEGVTVIRDNTFEGQSELREITIPSTVTSIGNRAFHDCEKLETVTLCEGLVSIGRQAFSNTAIRKLTIPSTVREMYDVGFSKCTYLETVLFLGDAPSVEMLPTPPDSEEAPYYHSPAYKIYHLLGSTGFTDPEWHGYSCELLEVKTQQYVTDRVNDMTPIYAGIPMHRVEILEGLDEWSIDGEIHDSDTKLIDTYEYFCNYEKSLDCTRYDKEYFDEHAILLIKVKHSSSEQVKGVAGMISKLEIDDTTTQAIIPVVMFDSPEPFTEDIVTTYILVEFCKADLREDYAATAGPLMAYNVRNGGSSCYYPGFLEQDK